MKHFLYVCFLLFSVGVSCAASQELWKQVSVVSFDWGRNGKVVTFSMEAPVQGLRGGGEFSRLRIEIPGRPDFVVQDDDGFDRIRSEATGYYFHHTQSLVHNDFLLFPKDLARPDHVPPLILVGWAYGSSPGSLSIIELDKNGSPRQVFYQQTYDLYRLRYRAKNEFELTGKQCMPQEFGNQLLTYDPFTTYLFSADGHDLARLSLRLSRLYNLAHYYGWAGPECREDVAVVMHPPHGGKPVIMDSKKAEKLTGSD